MNRRLFARIAQRPLPVVGIGAVVVVAALTAASGVRVDYSVEQFFPTWGQERAIFDEYRATFLGEDAQVAFFLATPDGLDAPSREILDDVARAFESRGIRDVQWPGGVEVVGPLGEHPLYGGVLSNPDGTVHAVQGRLAAEENHDAGRRAVVGALTDDIEALGIERRWSLSGVPVIRAQVPELLEVDQTVLLGGGIVLFFVLLALYFRHLGLALIGLAAVLPGYAVTLAVMALTDTPVTILTSFIPIVILVVGVCDTTHLLEHWCRARAGGADRVEAVSRTFAALAVSCFFTSVTTALGFASLAATGIGVVADFGLFTALAVMTTYLFTVSVLPALMALVRSAPRRPTRPRGPIGGLVRASRRVLAAGSPAVLGGFALVGLGALALGSTLQIDTYLVDDLKDDARIKQDMRWIEASGFGLFQTNLYVRADADSLVTPEMVAWMARFEEAVADEDLVVAGYGLPDLERAAGVPVAHLARLRPRQVPDWMLNREQGAAQVMLTVRDGGSRRTLAFLERADDFLVNDPPPYGTADLTGTVRMAHTFSFHVLRSFGPSIALALVLIWLVMAVLFRSARMGLVAMVPNVFPLVVLAGAMAVLGVPLKPSTILVFSIAFGIVVDDSIHLMSRYTHLRAQGRSDGRALRGALRQTGPALVLSTVVVSTGFSLLMLSRFELLFLLGLLTAITALTALAVDMLALPALLLRVAPNPVKAA
jgi:predicted RND superfamily exporter protein